MSQAPPPDFSAVITAIRSSGAAVRGAITQNTAVLRNLQQNIAQIGQPAPPPQETAAEKAARLLREAEARKQAAIQRRRDMLKRVGANVMKYSGANAVGRGLRNIGRRITRAASSVFTWGTAITAALAYFVNSPFWNEFKELLADSTKEGGWLNTFIKSIKEFFKPLEGIGKDLLKGEFGKATDKIVDFFIDLMNKMIDGINSKLPPFMKMDRFETREQEKINKETQKLSEDLKTNRLAKGGETAGEQVLDFFGDDPSTTMGMGMTPFSDENSKDLGGLMYDNFFSPLGDSFDAIGRAITGNLQTVQTMTKKQLEDNLKKVSEMSSEEFARMGNQRFQMSRKDLGLPADFRETVSADAAAAAKIAFMEKLQAEAKGRMSGERKRVDPNRPGVEVAIDMKNLQPKPKIEPANNNTNVGEVGASANGKSVAPTPVAPVAPPAPRSPTAPISPNGGAMVQPQRPAPPSISVTKDLRPNGVIPKLTQQAFP
jgi:hypothetical protein